MKRLSPLIMVLALLAGTLPALAQTNADLITLNDANPTIDAVITLPPDATGTIALDLAQAAVTLTDETGATVFYAADPRLHGLEFNIAPNSGSHTLTIQRLPGVSEAYVTVGSVPEMTINGAVNLIDSTRLTLNQETSLPLNVNNPGGTISVNIPAAETGVVTTTFPGAYATTQMVDGAGVVIAASTGGHVDGLTYVLDSGDYNWMVLSSNQVEPVAAGVRVVSLAEGGFTLLDVPAASSPAVVADNTPADCAAQIAVSSVNLRSGPGTGYSVLDYGYRGDVFPVGGQNPEQNWLVVGTPNGGSAWLALSAAQIQGACDNLAVFNLPLKDADPTSIIITTFGSTNGEREFDEHNDHDDNGFEHESDDD